MSRVLRCGLVEPPDRGAPLGEALEALCGLAGLGCEIHRITEAGSSPTGMQRLIAEGRAAGWAGLSVPRAMRDALGVALGGHGPATGAAPCDTVLFDPETRGLDCESGGIADALGTIACPPGRVVILGAGAAAAMVAPVLRELGATELAIADINRPRAMALAGAVRGRVLARDDIGSALRAATGIVNATPLGLAEAPGTAVDPAWLGPQRWVCETAPAERPSMLLRDARAAGLATIDAFDLFLAMAMRVFHAYTGLAPDPGAVRRTLEPLRKSSGRQVA